MKHYRKQNRICTIMCSRRYDHTWNIVNSDRERRRRIIKIKNVIYQELPEGGELDEQTAQQLGQKASDTSEVSSGPTDNGFMSSIPSTIEYQVRRAIEGLCIILFSTDRPNLGTNLTGSTLFQEHSSTIPISSSALPQSDSIHHHIAPIASTNRGPSGNDRTSTARGPQVILISSLTLYSDILLKCF